MQTPVSRRKVIAMAAALGLPAGLLTAVEAAVAEGQAGKSGLGPAVPFSFDLLKDRARTIGASAWVKPAPRHAEILERIDYDRFQEIKFRPDASVRLDRENRTPVQLFHLQRLFNVPVAVHVVANGEAREIAYSSELFDTPQGHPARGLPGDTGFAGFRVMNRDLKTDWLAFLGASYFRSSGPYNQYGLSARGLALNIGMPTAEEFPRFTAFWLERGAKGASPITVYALLDSPSVSGAYRMIMDKTTDASDVHRVTMEIEAELYPRVDVARVGIAPFSSMFWYGEGSRKRAADWRPEIHDSDGLSVLTGKGERIWRPLNNPRTVLTSVFADRDPKGFGLLQRDRDFVHYLDDGVFYERRPSTWVEPLDAWGEGAVHLLEIPTDDETFDNIAAYWCPKDGFKAGQASRWRYRLTWADDVPLAENLARATATWTGLGGRPGFVRPDGVRKYVIDWQGRVLDGVTRFDGVELVVSASRGTVTNAYAHPVVDQRERWRSFFDIDAKGGEPVDIRVFLRRGGTALTETWIGQYNPGE
jgi:glucans biosynthesis protein